VNCVFEAYAGYYDLLYRDKDYAAEAAYIGGLLSRHGVPAGGHLLELGCGTGRHGLELARLGYRLHGIDSSATMIRQAEGRLAECEAKQLLFKLGDLRTARLPEKFDAVTSLFHVASYQTTNADLLAMFQTAGYHLKLGGIFVFDCWYGPAVLADRPAVRVKRLEDENVRLTRIAEPTIEPNENRVDVHYEIVIESKNEPGLHRVHEVHRMRYLFKPEIEQLLKDAGLALLASEAWMSGAELGWTAWYATFVAGPR
jgi:SAM-dependent methyltransferase